MKTLSVQKLESRDVISEALAVLKTGGLVVFPSDTVYGLLVDATNPQAVEKLIAFKERPKGKAISVFVADFEMLRETVEVNSETGARLKELLPGPFTIILSSKHRTEKLLESENGTLGVRLPDNKRIQELVAQFGKPLSATSANISGSSPHYSIDAFFKTLSEKKKKLIDLVVDVGALPRNKPSTVLDMTTGDLAILREGEVASQRKHSSRSEEETKKIARDLVQLIYSSKQSKAVALIIQGDLGAGKTVFVKGIGEEFGIKNIVSPTYVVMYEYDVKNDNDVEKIAHFDLYNVARADEFQHLGFEAHLHPKNLLCLEWGERAGEVADLLREKASLIYVYIRHIDEKTREIEVRWGI